MEDVEFKFEIETDDNGYVSYEFLGIWEEIYNPNFNYGEFAIIKSQAGLNS